MIGWLTWIALSLIAPATQSIDTHSVGPLPDEVRAEFGISSEWYSKYLDADGIPVIGSADVSDAALRRARRDAVMLMQTLPRSVTATLRLRRNRIVILGIDETVRDIPEYAAAFPDDAQDHRYWGGFGATASLPITSGTEANILRGFNGENVFVHEFAHTVAEQALVEIDPGFPADLAAAFDHARRTGLWSNTYADDNVLEYWAEGTQSFFNVNREGPLDGDGVHNEINSRAELELYDRPLFQLLARIYLSTPSP